MEKQFPSNVSISREEWQQLHSRDFEVRIYEKLWSRVKIGFGVLTALAGVGIFAVLKGMIVADAAKEVQDNVSRTITASVQTRLTHAAETAGRNAATQEARRLLQETNNPLRTALNNSIRDILERGLVNDVMMNTVGRNFALREVPVAQRVMAFRVLVSLDAEGHRSEAALTRALQARLAIGRAVQGATEDQVLAEALKAWMERPQVEGDADLVRRDFTRLRSIAGLVFQVIEATRSAGEPASEALTDAAGAWLGQLEPAGEVAEWLALRPGAGRAVAGRPPVLWEFLLRDRRAPALELLRKLLGEGTPAQVSAAFQTLASISWPRMPLGEAEKFLQLIEQHVPGEMLGWPSLTAEALEARWALSIAQNLGPNARSFAWSLWAQAARAARIEPWTQPLNMYEQATRPVNPLQRIARADGGMPSLPPLALGADLNNTDWPLLVRRVVLSIHDDERSAFANNLLTPLAPESSMETARRRTRVIGLLALALGTQQPSATRTPAALNEAVLRAIAADVARSTELEVALQRLLPAVGAAECAAAFAEMRERRRWPAVALAACATGRDPKGLEALLPLLERVPADERDSLTSLWLLNTGTDASFNEVMAATSPRQRLATVGAEALYAGGGGLDSMVAQRFVASLRDNPDVARRQALDTALARKGVRGLYPALPQFQRGTLPDWAFPAWWQELGVVSVSTNPEGTTGVPSTGILRLSIACDPNTSVRMHIEGRPVGQMRGPDVIRIVAGHPIESHTLEDASDERRYHAVHQVVPPGCNDDAWVRLRAPAGLGVRLVREIAVLTRNAVIASSFETRGNATPLLVGQPLRISLQRGQTAFFPISFDTSAAHTIRTRNLTSGTDTVLALLDIDGEVLRDGEDDDGNPEEHLASLQEVIGTPVALRASTFDGNGGEFDLVLEHASNIERLSAPARLRLHLRRGSTVVRGMELQAGRRYVMRTDDLESGVDTVLRLSGPGGFNRLDNDGGGERASRLEITPRQTGRYRLHISTIRMSGEATLLLEEH